MKRKIKPLAVLSAALILAGSVPASTAFAATDEGSDTSHISQIVDPVVSNFYQYMLNDSGEAILLDIMVPRKILLYPTRSTDTRSQSLTAIYTVTKRI